MHYVLVREHSSIGLLFSFFLIYTINVVGEHAICKNMYRVVDIFVIYNAVYIGEYAIYQYVRICMGT